jgi:homoserine dehydrogenase
VSSFFEQKGALTMLILSRVCADFRDRAGNIVHRVTPVNRLTFHEAPDSIREDPLFRLLVNDRPGVLAAIASTFAAQQMSIASVIQKAVVENGLAELIIITYKVSRLSLDLSLRTLQVLPVVKVVSAD